MKSQDNEFKNSLDKIQDTKVGQVIKDTLGSEGDEKELLRDTRGEIFTIPNLLSMLRIALVPIYVYTYIGRQDYMLTAVLVVLSAITDVADGYIARRFNMITDVGKALDPIADKLTQFSLMLCLLTRFPNMIYPAVLIFIKEITTGILGLVTIKKTGQVKGAAWYGKAATVLIYITMLLHLLWVNIPSVVSDGLILACCAMMLLCFILYGARYVVMLKAGRPQEEEKTAVKEENLKEE